MVAREPGESDADYELRQRDHRHSKSRCLASSSSEEEEEKESRAAGSAAGSELGAAGSAAPVVIAEEREEKEESYPGRHLQVETARSATSPGGTRRPAATLIGLANPADQEATQTSQVRGLRGQSEIRQGSGPDPSERLELNPRPPSQSPAPDAPWNRPRGSELKRTHSKGFRLRSAQSRQYRNLRGQLSLAKRPWIEGTDRQVWKTATRDL
jgi:hypothetical protein